MYLCLSALAESSSGTSMMCSVLFMDDIRVDECSNEDPGPLPGPRCMSPEFYRKLTDFRTSLREYH